MKKNKDIEVKVEELTKNSKGEKSNVHQLSIGKKIIGEVEKVDSKKFVVTIEGESPKFVRSFEEGYEALISYWNLFQQ